MTHEDSQTEIETSVLILGMGYAASMIGVIFWLAG